MNTTLTRQQKKAALGTDFLDRDQDNYVKVRRTGRLGWESLIPEGGNYSDLLRNASRQEDVIVDAYNMAREYIVAMDTPYKVLLRLSSEMNCTDSRVVYLATHMFDDKDLSVGQQIDTFVGLAIHEGCHLKWTDFTQKASESNFIIRNLINLLEDERIERLCGEIMPGYANYLKATKYYMFDLYCQKQQEKNANKKLDAPVRLLNAIISLIRYPKSLPEDDLEEFVDYLYDVRAILLNFPKDSEEVTAAAHAIYEVIKRFFEENPQQNLQGADKGQGDSSSEDAESQKKQSGEGSGESGQDAESESGGLSTKNQNDGSESGQGEPEGEKKTDETSADNGSGTGGRQLSKEEIEQLLSDLAEAMEDMEELTGEPDGQGEPIDDDQMSDAVKRNSGQLAGICENQISLGETSKAVLYKAQEDKDAYRSSLSRVRKYIPAIAKTLKGHCSEYDVIYHGMRSGTLDTSKIAEAYQGVQNVYIREGKIKSDKMAVCVLIDESGSMYGEKISAAQDLAVLLNEAIGSIPSIDLYIYGHTYGDRCEDSYRAGERIAELQVYHEKGYTPKTALGTVEARAGNLDSYAISEAAARMRRMSNCKQNLMFVITDGAPNESYLNLTNTVKRLELQGMNIVAVCIEPSYDPSALYTHHVLFKDMNRLAIDLGKMIKKAILKRSNRTSA